MFKWCISTTQGGTDCDVAPMTASPPNLRDVALVGAGGLSLDPGQYVYIGARANEVGLWSEVAWSGYLGIATMELKLRPGDRAELVCDANLPGARTLYKQDAHPPWLLRCHRDFLRAAGACVRPTHRPHPLLDRLQEITKSNSWGDTDEILTDGLAGWILVPSD